MKTKGDSWLTFAGLMLILAGALTFMDGLWAWTLSSSERAGSSGDLKLYALFSNNLNTWAWVYLIAGGVLVVAGFAVFARVKWAVVVGIFAGLVGATLNMLWIFDYPFTAFVLVALNILVVYGLTVYGLADDEPAVR